MLKDSEKEEKKEEAENKEGNQEEKREEIKSEVKEEEIKEIIKWYENYAKRNGFRLNPDRATVERLVKGLLANEKKYGARYCPCRRVTGNIEEDRPKICPCRWHREEIKRDGHCHCWLFFRKDYNPS
ncbi:ferredoxin:thioredoxin reductase [bacterium]|nr:ferredoxin:thioredoxin reductase [bacterium]